MNKLTSFIFAALLLAQFTSLHATDVADLRCEYRIDPLEIEVAKPRLEWKIEVGDQPPSLKLRRPWTSEIGGPGSERVRGLKQTDKRLTTTNIDKCYKGGQLLLPSGLIGPVRVMEEK